VGASLADSVRYEVSSFVPGTAYAAAVPKYADLGPAARARYLQLPELDARIAGLAREYAGQGSELGRALALQNRLKTSYGYTLEFPSTAVADPLANFLFTRKQGHCEYFASSMAIMLRTLGIPARIVNGFQSGRFNPMSGLYVIRASDAHSWVEAFLPGEGWVTFDPTPAAQRTTADSWNTQMALFFDAADTFWQDWVVHYDLGHQITLAERLEEGTRRLRWEWGGGRPVNWGAWKSNAARGLKRWAAPAIALALAVVLLVWGRGRLGRYRLRQRSRRGRVSPKDATLLYERMLRVMRRKGFQKPPWFTPGEFAATLPASPAGELVARFTASYHAVRFGGDAASVRELGSLIEQLERL
jgi:hypothetical protein